MFLFTLTITILGLSYWLYLFSAMPNTLSSPLIATDWEMLTWTSIVKGMTSAAQAPTLSRRHHSNLSLHLTDPSLDPPGPQTTFSRHSLSLL
jgi:hypothetical protein